MMLFVDPDVLPCKAEYPTLKGYRRKGSKCNTQFHVAIFLVLIWCIAVVGVAKVLF